MVLVLPGAWALVCSDGDGGAQGTTGCWERTPAPGGGGARPKNDLARPPIRVFQSTAGSTETRPGQSVQGRGGEFRGEQDKPDVSMVGSLPVERGNGL